MLKHKLLTVLARKTINREDCRGPNTHTHTNSAIFAALDVDAKTFTMSNNSAATKLVTVVQENKASTGPREGRGAYHKTIQL